MRYLILELFGTANLKRRHAKHGTVVNCNLFGKNFDRQIIPPLEVRVHVLFESNSWIKCW